MKKAAILVLAVCFLFIASFASAATYSNVKTWSPYTTVEDYVTYTIPVTTPTPALALTSGTLKITHRYNDNDSGEVWYAYGESNQYIGKLGDSDNNSRTDTFTLSQSILNDIMNNTPWSLVVKLDENTSHDDYLRLYSSEICGEYTEAQEPVPEPATMILLGSALAGLAARRKFKK